MLSVIPDDVTIKLLGIYDKCAG